MLKILQARFQQYVNCELPDVLLVLEKEEEPEVGNQTIWPASGEICIQDKKQQLELDMEQQTGSNRKRSTSRLYIVTLLI